MKTFIGIDLHTNRFTCCYRDEAATESKRDVKRTETFDLTAEGLAAFYQTLTPESHVLVEATTPSNRRFAFCFVRLFRDKVAEVVIANTCELKAVSLARKNTDKIDADILCRLIRKRSFRRCRR